MGVDDVDEPAQAVDQPTFFECFKAFGHACPSNTKQMSQDFVGERQLIVLEGIAGDEQPSGESLLDGVCRIADASIARSAATRHLRV
ncbi:hypothetical protein ACVWXP_007463 [Bradyrhizobium sp. USDA 4463]